MPRTPFPLGRKVQHDPRSLNFPARTELPVITKTWRRYGGVLDQGALGSCTGNAAAQALNHLPLRTKGVVRRESDAVRFYGRATVLDQWPGVYPPDDTGSSGLAVAKALQEEGLISRYEHAFGLEHGLSVLMEAPLLVGSNWYSDMFYPDAKGVVRPTGSDVGGHEYLWIGADMPSRTVHFLNSWSDLWGDRGRFHMSFESFQTLLDQQGDLIRLVK